MEEEHTFTGGKEDSLPLDILDRNFEELRNESLSNKRRKLSHDGKMEVDTTDSSTQTIMTEVSKSKKNKRWELALRKLKDTASAAHDLDPSLLLYTNDSAEVKSKMESFVEHQQNSNSRVNLQEYLSDLGGGCSRTSKNQIQRDYQIRRSFIVDQDGPFAPKHELSSSSASISTPNSTTTSTTTPQEEEIDIISDRAAPSGIEERLRDVEDFFYIASKFSQNAPPSLPQTIYSRLKAIENKILSIEQHSFIEDDDEAPSTTRTSYVTARGRLVISPEEREAAAKSKFSSKPSIEENPMLTIPEEPVVKIKRRPGRPPKYPRPPVDPQLPKLENASVIPVSSSTSVQTPQTSVGDNPVTSATPSIKEESTPTKPIAIQDQVNSRIAQLRAMLKNRPSSTPPSK